MRVRKIFVYDAIEITEHDGLTTNIQMGYSSIKRGK